MNKKTEVAENSGNLLKQLESTNRKLEAANDDFELLLKHMVCGVCIFQVDKERKYTLKYMSDGFCELC